MADPEDLVAGCCLTFVRSPRMRSCLFREERCWWWSRSSPLLTMDGSWLPTIKATKDTSPKPLSRFYPQEHHILHRIILLLLLLLLPLNRNWHPLVAHSTAFPNRCHLLAMARQETSVRVPTPAAAAAAASSCRAPPPPGRRTPPSGPPASSRRCPNAPPAGSPPPLPTASSFWTASGTERAANAFSAKPPSPAPASPPVSTPASSSAAPARPPPALLPLPRPENTGAAILPPILLSPIPSWVPSRPLPFPPPWAPSRRPMFPRSPSRPPRCLRWHRAGRLPLGPLLPPVCSPAPSALPPGPSSCPTSPSLGLPTSVLPPHSLQVREEEAIFRLLHDILDCIGFYSLTFSFDFFLSSVLFHERTINQSERERENQKRTNKFLFLIQ